MIEALSDNIQALIKIRGIQVGKLEKQLGVSAGYFARVRRGMSISSEVLYKLSKAVDVSMDDLCSKGYKNRLIKEDRPLFVSSPTEVIKVGEPVSNSDEINKALEKGEMYKRGFEDAMRRFKRPHGEWLWLCDSPDPKYKCEWLRLCDSPDPKYKWSCNKCGRGVKEQENFCPNCGVEMKGGAE